LICVLWEMTFFCTVSVLPFTVFVFEEECSVFAVALEWMILVVLELVEVVEGCPSEDEDFRLFFSFDGDVNDPDLRSEKFRVEVRIEVVVWE